MDNNLNKLDQRLSNIEAMLRANKPTLTLEDASLYTGLSKSYLYKLTSTCQIPHFKPNGKLVYFSREELDRWMLRNKVATTDDLSVKAATYTLTKPMKS